LNEVPFFIVDAFTQTPYRGNPAGVVLTQQTLTNEQMQAIARELHLETAFATPLSDGTADFQVAYFTGTARVPLCGHDTIALAVVLAQTGRIPSSGKVRFATDVGILSISTASDASVTMDQAPPIYGPLCDPAGAAEALGLPVSEIAETYLPVQIISTGTPFLIVPVHHRSALDKLDLDMSTLNQYGKSLSAADLGFYVWTSETLNVDAQIYARCFFPAIGLPEDPVTGTASGAVGAYLARHGQLLSEAEGVLTLKTEQGYAMGRPGNVSVRLEMRGSEVARVQVGGYAVVVGEGRLAV
jgi:trans-2,3-dihydro-3-hydroxyanthranilate isomerase